MSGLRVLHTVHSLAAGGAERQLALLCRHSPDAGIESATVYMQRGGAGDDELQDRRLFHHERKRHWDFSIFGTIRDAIREFKPDLLHAWLPPVVVVPSLWAGWATGTPTIVSYRNTEHFTNWLSIGEHLFSWPLADGLVSNNPVTYSSRAHRALFARKNGRLIRNAVDVPPKLVRDATERGNDVEPLKLVFVGRLAPQKNWPTLLDALARLESHVDWVLEVCGDGHERADFEARVQSLGLAGRVRVAGFVSGAYERIAAADALVLPSWHEGMPNVVLEAWALGTPVVMSDIPAHRALPEANAASVMVPPADAGALADALEALYTDPARRVALASAGLVASRSYTVARMVEQYREFYTAALARSEAGRPRRSAQRQSHETEL